MFELRKISAAKSAPCWDCRVKWEEGAKIVFRNDKAGGESRRICVPCANELVEAGKAEWQVEKKTTPTGSAGVAAMATLSKGASGNSNMRDEIADQFDQVFESLSALEIAMTRIAAVLNVDVSDLDFATRIYKPREVA